MAEDQHELTADERQKPKKPEVVIGKTLYGGQLGAENFDRYGNLEAARSYLESCSHTTNIT